MKEFGTANIHIYYDISMNYAIAFDIIAGFHTFAAAFSLSY
jgi:hypothetical protein